MVTLFRPNEDIPSEFDYVYLMNRLSDYSDPWGRVRRMLKSGEIVRVKKGLYVPGNEYGTRYSNLILANLIFGPSYVSFASALAHYGFIPESPASVWSVTPSRKKSFSTPVGTFDYFFQSINLYAAGMTRMQIDGEKFALIATPEKSLFDFVKFRLGNSRKEVAPTVDLLLEDLRIDEDSLRRLSVSKLEDLSKVSKIKLATELAKCVRKIK